MACQVSLAAMRLGLTMLVAVAVPAAGCAADNGAPAPPPVGYARAPVAAPADGITRLPPAESIPPGYGTAPDSAMVVPPASVSPEPTARCWLFRCFQKADAAGLSRVPPGYKPARLGPNEG
ncbi:MAG TPA: hypothetical protein VHV55_28160 [Pirellulales bacterium]|nr:hypothetical protein [Pirellulales bacterium]